MAAESWYSEIKDYPKSYGEVGFSGKHGHFTQLVWKATTQMGVGVATSNGGGMTRIFVVANYNPAGNMRGGFAANVLKPSV
jgi:hypothetical protein